MKNFKASSVIAMDIMRKERFRETPSFSTLTGSCIVDAKIKTMTGNAFNNLTLDDVRWILTMRKAVRVHYTSRHTHVHTTRIDDKPE